MRDAVAAVPPPAAPVGQQRLASTGITALDSKLVGVVRGRHYLICGVPGAGKTSMSLQFLGAGLEAGERCVLLTQDDPEDLLAQAQFLGYSLRSAVEEERLLVIRFRLDFARNFIRAANPQQVFRELSDHLGELRPDRFVIDSLLPLLEGGRATADALDAFPEFLAQLHTTTYLTVPREPDQSLDHRMYDRITAAAGGIFHLRLLEDQIRELNVRKLRQPMTAAAPLRFAIRQGVGIVPQESSRSAPELPPEVRRRVVLLNPGAMLLEELLPALETAYEVVSHDDVEHAFADLAAGSFGALIIGMSPDDPERAFQLTLQIRRAGNRAPILLLAQGRGLRASMRARGLRAGVDDFLTDELSPEEFLERIEVARARGHRPTMGEGDLEPLFRQPRADDGSYPLLTEAEFRAAIQTKLVPDRPRFFTLVALSCKEEAIAGAWDALSRSLRLHECDLGARLDDGRIILYLHDVRRHHLSALLERISMAHENLRGNEPREVICYPGDREALGVWLASTGFASAGAYVR